MRKSVVVTLSVLAIVFAMAAASWAGPTLDRIKKNGEIIVGTCPTIPPFTAKAKNGMIIGYDSDVANILAGAMGVKLRYVEIPFPELLDALEAGKIDAIISAMTITPKRNMRAVFVGPYFVSGQTVLGTNALMAKINGREDLNSDKYTVVAAEGTTSLEATEKLLGKAKLVKAANPDAGLKLLLEKKADMMMVDFGFAFMAAYRYKDKGLAVIGKPFTFEPLGIGIKPGDPEFANLLENFLLVFHGSGQAKVVEQRWFQRSSWMKELAE